MTSISRVVCRVALVGAILLGAATPARASSVLFSSFPPANCSGAPLFCQSGPGVPLAWAGSLFVWFTLKQASIIEQIEAWALDIGSALEIWDQLPCPPDCVCVPNQKIAESTL